MLRAMFVFVAVVLVDMIWARYIQDTSGGQRLRAASWASTLYVLGGYVVTQYTDDVRLLIPATLGAFVGTYFGTKPRQADT